MLDNCLKSRTRFFKLRHLSKMRTLDFRQLPKIATCAFEKKANKCSPRFVRQLPKMRTLPSEQMFELATANSAHSGLHNFRHLPKMADFGFA